MLSDLPVLFASQVARSHRVTESWLSTKSHLAHLEHLDHQNNLQQAIVQLEYLGYGTLVGEVTPPEL